jgi:hypothetical protein
MTPGEPGHLPHIPVFAENLYLKNKILELELREREHINKIV